MENDLQKRWQACLNLIKREVSPQSYKTWFSVIEVTQYENNTLTLRVPNQFFCEWLEANYLKLLKHVIKKEFGEEARLTYQLPPSPTHTTKAKPNTAFFSLQLNPRCTFDKFVVGECNELAHATAEAVINNIGNTPFNPLFLHGNTGLGKSHLIQAMAHAGKSQNLRIGHVTTQCFTAQFIQNLRANRIQAFMDAYNQLDVLMVDDIQFLANKEKTQEIFFHIFNHLHQANKQIVITSDVPPNQLINFETRLCSRFKWGSNVELHRPDFETRVAIIQSKLHDYRLVGALDDAHIDYIATNVVANVREIEGVLASLMVHATLKKATITKEVITLMIQQIAQTPTLEPKITTKYLTNKVSEHFKMPIEKIKSADRHREILIPRQLIMYLARKYTDESLQHIGKALNRKDHTTVKNAMKKTEDRLSADHPFRQLYQNIEQEILREAPAMAAKQH